MSPTLNVNHALFVSPCKFLPMFTVYHNQPLVPHFMTPNQDMWHGTIGSNLIEIKSMIDRN
jgi:hypothetical protein